MRETHEEDSKDQEEPFDSLRDCSDNVDHFCQWRDDSQFE
jgi:hypothetical protein